MSREVIHETGYTEVSDSGFLPQKPLVSVHMLAYNHGPYLAEAIEGVIAQKADFPIELIIGEDCSTDNTREIALDYQRRYPHLIRVIYSDYNVGMGENCRRVIDACRGKYIAFCEGDDYWVNDSKLSIQINELLKFRAVDLCFHSALLKYSNLPVSAKKIIHRARNKTSIISIKEIIEGGGEFMPTASIVVRSKICKKIPNYFFESAPVLDYFIQVFGSKRGGAIYIDKPLSVYRFISYGSWSFTRKYNIEKDIEDNKVFVLSIIKLNEFLPGYYLSINKMLFISLMNSLCKSYRYSHFYFRKFAQDNLKNILTYQNIFFKMIGIISISKRFYIFGVILWNITKFFIKITVRIKFFFGDHFQKPSFLVCFKSLI